VPQARWVLKSATPAPAFNPPDPTSPPGVGRCGRRDDGYLDVSSGERSQIFTVSSKLPLTIRFPSGLKLTLVTASECPLSVSVS